MKRYKYSENNLNLTSAEKKDLKKRLIVYKGTFSNSRISANIDITSIIDYYVKAFNLPPRAKTQYLKLNYNLPENKKKLYNIVTELIDFL